MTIFIAISGNVSLPFIGFSILVIFN